jgi:hypothetical protein
MHLFCDMLSAIPIRIVVVHHFISTRLLNYLVPVFIILSGLAIRKRYVSHTGTEEQLLEELQEYGIDRKILPDNVGGILDFSYSAWLDSRRSKALFANIVQSELVF